MESKSSSQAGVKTRGASRSASGQALAGRRVRVTQYKERD